MHNRNPSGGGGGSSNGHGSSVVVESSPHTTSRDVKPTGTSEDNPSPFSPTTELLQLKQESAALSSTQSSSSSSSPTPSSSGSQSVGALGTKLEIAGILALNLFSVVGIVAVNKKIFQTPGFQFPSTLMSLHFIVTYAFVVVLLKLGYFAPKKIETMQYVKLGAAQVGSVALVNLSLVFNDVGTYQLMKFLVIFVTCILEYLFYRKVYSAQVYSVLAILVVSISFATITSIAPSTTGLLFGLGGALGTSYYQILNKFIQTEHQVSALQLLHYEQPFSAAWCFLFALLTEPVQHIFVVEWSAQLIQLVALSAICAFGVNVSVYLIIGKTGPITYSVLGHVKTISIFGIGVFFLGDKFSNTQAFWMFIAFLMIVVYGHVSNVSAPAASAPKKQVEGNHSSTQDSGKESAPLLVTNTSSSSSA